MRLSTLKPSPKNYAVQALAPTTAPIARGDRVQISFWARAASPNGAKATFSLEGALAPNVKSGEFAFDATPEWRQFSRNLVTRADYACGAANIAFHVGQQIQELEIGGLQVVSVGRDTARIPAQGTPLLAPDALATAQLAGAAAAMPLERIAASGTDFKDALRPEGIGVGMTTSGVGQRTLSEHIPLLLRQGDAIVCDCGRFESLGRALGTLTRFVEIERQGRTLLRFNLGAAVIISLRPQADSDGFIRAELKFPLAAAAPRGLQPGNSWSGSLKST